MKSRTEENTRKRECWFNYCIPKPLRISPRNYQQTLFYVVYFLIPAVNPPTPSLPWTGAHHTLVGASHTCPGKAFYTYVLLFYFFPICTQYFPDSLMSCWINISHVYAPFTLLETFTMISTCNPFFLTTFQHTQKENTFHKSNKAAWLGAAILAVPVRLNTVHHNSLIEPVQLLTEQQKWEWDKRWLCFWAKLGSTGHLGLQQPTSVQYNLLEGDTAKLTLVSKHWRKYFTDVFSTWIYNTTFMIFSNFFGLSKIVQHRSLCFGFFFFF